MEQSVWCVDVCERATFYNSHFGVVMGHSVTFFAVASLFSEVTIDSCLEHGKSWRICSFSNILSDLEKHD